MDQHQEGAPAGDAGQVGALGQDHAFPVYPRIEGGVVKQVKGKLGLTKREWFAGMAMQGLLAGLCFETRQEVSAPPESEVAKFSLQYADALLAALQQSQAREGAV